MKNSSLAWVLLGALLIIAMWALREVMPVIVLSLMYAILTWPLVQRLQKRIPTVAAIILVDAGLALAAVALGVAFWPLLYQQIQGAIAALPQASTAALLNLPPDLQQTVTSGIQRLDINLADYAQEALRAALALVRSTVALVAAIVVIPFLGAYFQLDAPRYARALFTAIPEEYHPCVRQALGGISLSVGGFIRGQLIVSVIVGTLCYIVLALCGVPFAPIIALLTATADLVPYLGGIAAFVPSLLFALAVGGVWKALLVALLLIGVFELEAQFLSPQIVGMSVRLPTSVVVVSLLVGGAAFGIFGLYLAVPAAASILAIARAFAASSRPEI